MSLERKEGLSKVLKYVRNHLSLLRSAMVLRRRTWANKRTTREKANIFKNRFRSGGEENERRMANNLMQDMRVYDGYLVWLDLVISPATAPEILLATS